MGTILNAIEDHQPPFGCLGVGRLGLRFKIQRMLWSLRTEFRTHSDLEACISNLVTVLTDCGTERGIARVRSLCVAEALPHILDEVSGGDRKGEGQLVQLKDGMDMDSESDRGEVDSEATVDFAAALGIDGPQHMLHGVTEDLSRAMEEYDSCVEGMTHISRMLRRPHYRERLFSRCYTTAVGKALRPVLTAYKGHIFSGRWGTVASTVPEVLAIEHALKHGWNLIAFGTGREDVGGGLWLMADGWWLVVGG